MDYDLMLRMLDKIPLYGGQALLEVIPMPDVGISELSVYYEEGRYLFTLLEFSEDGTAITRVANLPHSKELVHFHGELFPASDVITDFEFIKNVFSVFLTTHDVPYDLMKT